MHVLSTPPAFVLSQDQTLRECLPVIGCTHHESGTTGRNKTRCSQRPRCVLPAATHNGAERQDFQRNHQPAEAGRGINISGVDFWHAVEFSRNGRFLRSRFTGPLRALPFGTALFRCLAFPTLSDSFVSDSRSKRAVQFRFPGSSLSRFPFPASPTLPDSFSFRFRSEGDFWWPAEGLAFRRIRLYQKPAESKNNPTESIKENHSARRS